MGVGAAVGACQSENHKEKDGKETRCSTQHDPTLQPADLLRSKPTGRQFQQYSDCLVLFQVLMHIDNQTSVVVVVVFKSPSAVRTLA